MCGCVVYLKIVSFKDIFHFNCVGVGLVVRIYFICTAKFLTFSDSGGIW